MYITIPVNYHTPDGRLAIPHSTTICTGTINPFARINGKKLKLVQKNVPTQCLVFDVNTEWEVSFTKDLDFIKEQFRLDNSLHGKWAVVFRAGTIYLIDDDDTTEVFDGFLTNYQLPKTRMSKSTAMDILLTNESVWCQYINGITDDVQRRVIHKALCLMQKQDYPSAGLSSSDSNVIKIWEETSRQDMVALVTIVGIRNVVIRAAIEMGLPFQVFPEYHLAKFGRDNYRLDYMEPRIVSVFKI